MDVDLIVHDCSELHTLEGSKPPRIGEEMEDTGLIKNAAVIIDDGVIIDYGPSEEICEIYSSDKTVDASGKTVIPGFVDPHTHLVFAGSREDELVMKIEGKTYMEILEAGGGISRTVRHTREADKKELKDQTKKRLDMMLRYGTTTAEAKSGYGLDKETEIRCLKVIEELNDEHPIDLIPTYMGAHSLPPEFDIHGDYIDYCIDEVLPEVVDKKLAEYCDVFCEKGVFGVKDSRKLLDRAKELGLGVRVHADEIENIGCSCMAADIGAVSAEHLVKTSAGDIKKMADKAVTGVLLPGTPFMLMEDEYSPARKMIEEGMPVALATDLNPNCYTESMQMVITLACLNMKMTPSEALTAATVNSAATLNRNDIGNLSVGSKADFVILDVPNHMHIPYHFGVNLVEQVYKDGEKVI